MPARILPAVVIAGLVVLFALARADDADPPDAWILEAGPEREGAAKAGAADVKKAQKLAKKKKYRDAVVLLERTAREWPAAIHDCNLALAYLRAGAYTRAQLLWEISALRNTDRPEWCTGTLGEELATALRSAGYVPLTISVVPGDAIVEVGGVVVRGLRVLWLAPGRHTVRARADTYLEGVQEIDVAAPSATAEITLDPIVPPDAAVPDAGPVDAAPVAVLVDAAPPPPIDAMPPPRAASKPLWPAWIAFGAGGGALVAGLGFHVAAVGSRDDANLLHQGTPELDVAKNRFERQRALAVGGYLVGTAAIGFAAWWLLDARKSDEQPQVGITVTDDGAAVTVGGAW